MIELEYFKQSAKSFDDTVAAIESASVRNGFRVLHIHNVQQTLKEKGFEIQKYDIVEVCNAKFAYQVLSTDKTVGMMLPCRIVVYEESGKVHVLLMKPTAISQIMPHVDFGSIPQEVETILMKVVDEAVE